MSCHCFPRFFCSIYRFLTKIGQFSAKTAPKWPRRFSKKPADLSDKLADLLVFPVFTVPPSSLVCFGRIFPIFTNFYRIFKKLMGSVFVVLPNFQTRERRAYIYKRRHWRRPWLLIAHHTNSQHLTNIDEQSQAWQIVLIFMQI
jgi:hypothetical protein